jgi:NDP-sugar pyrophosphorylase family protein
MALEIVLPMAGLGSRFRALNFREAKPLVPWQSTPLFLHALSSLERLLPEARVTAVVSCLDDLADPVADLISGRWPQLSFRVVEIDGITAGSAETVAIAANDIPKDHALLSLDCDLLFQSREFESLVSGIREGTAHWDGALCTFTSQRPQYSYVEVKDGEVARIREKQVISDRAVLGAYFFRRTGDYLKAFDELKDGPRETVELYVSGVIALMLKSGKRFGISQAEEYQCLGTPAELLSAGPFRGI